MYIKTDTAVESEKPLGLLALC